MDSRLEMMRLPSTGRVGMAPRAGTGGENYVLGLNDVALGVDSDAVGAGDATGALDVVDVVLAKEEAHAACVAVNDSAAASHGNFVIGMKAVEFQTEFLGPPDV